MASTPETSARCPVAFDHDSHEHALNWPSIYRTLRESCPRPWTDSHDGYWVATRYKDVLAIAQRKEEFGVTKHLDEATGAVSGGVTIPPLSFRVAPNEIDFPEWQGLRSFLNRHFAPKAVDARRSRAAELTTMLMDDVIETGRLDIVDSLASPMPALMTMEIVGFPLDRWELFADAFHRMIYLPKGSPEQAKALQSVHELGTIIRDGMADRRANPREDLLTHLVHGTIDGQPIDEGRIEEIVYNVLGGGIDTTTALTSNALLYLARNPSERQRLIDDPALLPIACEEFVRFFSPIQVNARNAIQPAAVDEWKIEGGERVLLAYASANRDPEIFDEPDKLVLDRYPNRHIGFGAGMHRCMGSFLARMMFETMVTEVLTRIPDYTIEEDRIAPYTSLSTVNGWITMPARFTPGPRVHAATANGR